MENYEETVKIIKIAQISLENGLKNARTKVTKKRIAVGSALKALMVAKNDAKKSLSDETIDSICACQC